MYEEYLNKFWYSAKALENSKVCFSIPTGAHYLPHSSKYVVPLSINIVRQWFLMIRYGQEVSAKGTLRKSLLPPRWSLANGINIDYANIFWEDIIIKLKKKQREKLVVFKAPKTSSKAESVSQGTNLRAQTGHNKPLTSSQQPSMSSKEATKGGSSKAPTDSKTGHSIKRKESSSAMDSNLSQPLVSTPVDTGMHKGD
ncbi:hypothetical protein Tco_1226851 [Tanacetum coccineum]